MGKYTQKSIKINSILQVVSTIEKTDMLQLFHYRRAAKGFISSFLILLFSSAYAASKSFTVTVLLVGSTNESMQSGFILHAERFCGGDKIININDICFSLPSTFSSKHKYSMNLNVNCEQPQGVNFFLWLDSNDGKVSCILGVSNICSYADVSLGNYISALVKPPSSACYDVNTMQDLGGLIVSIGPSSTVFTIS